MRIKIATEREQETVAIKLMLEQWKSSLAVAPLTFWKADHPIRPRPDRPIGRASTPTLISDQSVGGRPPNGPVAQLSSRVPTLPLQKYLPRANVAEERGHSEQTKGLQGRCRMRREEGGRDSPEERPAEEK